MTIEELFEHFHVYFDKIVYYDETANVQDTVYLDGEYQEISTKYDEFYNEYKDYIVDSWEVGYDGLSIHVDIEKGEEL